MAIAEAVLNPTHVLHRYLFLALLLLLLLRGVSAAVGAAVGAAWQRFPLEWAEAEEHAAVQPVPVSPSLPAPSPSPSLFPTTSGPCPLVPAPTSCCSSSSSLRHARWSLHVWLSAGPNGSGPLLRRPAGRLAAVRSAPVALLQAIFPLPF